MKHQTTEFTALRDNSEDETPSRRSFDLDDIPMDKQDPSEKDHRTRREARPVTFKQKCSHVWKSFAPFPWKTFIIISSLPLALAPIIALARAAEGVSRNYMQGRDCYPNGRWSETKGATWRIMDSSYFFTPNLSFGSMAFTSAKIIDIIWDVCVGRGGQLLLAYVNYTVFNEWLLYHMEMHLTSYKMYTAIAFKTTTVTTLGVLAKEFLAFGESNWRRLFRWLAMLSMLLSTLYVISFPTLMAAMTGYITTYEPYILDFDNNLIELEKFEALAFAIEDPSRIGDYSKPLIVTYHDTALRDAVWNYTTTTVSPDNSSEWSFMWQQDVSDGNYANFLPPQFLFNKSSVWKFGNDTRKLDSPTLNITWMTSCVSDLSDKIDMMYYTNDGRQGDIYNASYLLSHGSCKPSETYQWGFSYIFLFMVSIFNFIWSCIMVGMWFDTARASRVYKSGRRPGMLKSVLDLAKVIREEIGEHADTLEEDELRKAIRDSGGSLLVPSKVLSVERTNAGRSGDSVKKRGWKKSLTSGSTF